MASLDQEEDIDEQNERIYEEDMQFLFNAVRKWSEFHGILSPFLTTSMLSGVSPYFQELILTGSNGDCSFLLSVMAGNSVDLDIMYVFKHALVLTDPTDAQMTNADSSVYVFVATNSNDNPGYCFLSLIKEGYLISNPLFSKSLGTGFYVQKNGQSLLSSRYLSEYMRDIAVLPSVKGQGGRYEESHSIQGPALTLNMQNMNLAGIVNVVGCDCVASMKCKAIPDIAMEFFTRSRGCWPPRSVLEDIYHSGCYFVPKGKRGSDSFEYEWCISFAHAEKKIVHSMDSTAFGVLEILKLFTRNVFQPQIGDLLTSYMVKTSLFWTLEEINYGSGAQYSIVWIIRECIRRILDWVTDNFLPHYFVRQMDVIKCLLNNPDRRIVISCLRWLVPLVKNAHIIS